MPSETKSPVIDAPANGTGPRPGSDRSFGYFAAAIIAGVGLYGLWRGNASAWAGIGAAVLLGIVAGTAPRALHGANVTWFRLGMGLARIANPVVIGVMFFLVITPVGLLMRLFGKRPLSLRFDDRLSSYWIERSPRGPAPASMRDQF